MLTSHFSPSLSRHKVEHYQHDRKSSDTHSGYSLKVSVYVIDQPAPDSKYLLEPVSIE